MIILQRIYYFFLFLTLIAAILPFWNKGWWWVRVFDFPRLQIFVMAIILLVILLAGVIVKYNSISFYLIALGLIASLGLDMFRIYPYAFSRKKESATYNGEKSLAEFSVLSANILQHNEEYDKIFKLIAKKDPDIVMLLETNKKWVEKCKQLDERYPHGVFLPQENGYGKVIYSKYPLKNTVVEHLVDENVPSVFTDIVINPKTTLHFIGLHPRPPRPNEGDSVQRDSELMLVAEYIKKNEGKPILVAGDLNDVAWSHTTRLFRRVSGTLDPRIGRGMYNTFHANYLLVRFPLDHLFHTERLMISEIARLEHVGSDHFPLWAKFHILEQPSAKQEPEKKQEGDDKEREELQERGKDWVSPDDSKDDPL